LPKMTIANTDRLGAALGWQLRDSGFAPIARAADVSPGHVVSWRFPRTGAGSGFPDILLVPANHTKGAKRAALR